MNQTNNILGYLYYKKGKQATNFRICNNYINKDGSKGFSKWSKYLDATLQQIDKATHRTILKNEVVLDFDPEPNETIEELKERVKKVYLDLTIKKIKFKCYETGSRGYHIHIFLNQMLLFKVNERIDLRNRFIKKYNAEKQKNTEGVTIAIEGVPHWKSGKVKKEVFFYG